MVLTTIDNQRWDLTDATGRVVELPAATLPQVELPVRWRIFGPADAGTTELTATGQGQRARVLVDTPVHELSAVPDELVVGNQTLKRRDVKLIDGTLDLDALFGGHEVGQQAFLFAEFNLSDQRELTFGAGCDWWMQWWIDGQVVCDTMQRGNRLSPPRQTDHCFGRPLSPGKHLLAVRLISGEAS